MELDDAEALKSLLHFLLSCWANPVDVHHVATSNMWFGEFGDAQDDVE